MCAQITGRLFALIVVEYSKSLQVTRVLLIVVAIFLLYDLSWIHVFIVPGGLLYPAVLLFFFVVIYYLFWCFVVCTCLADELKFNDETWNIFILQIVYSLYTFVVLFCNGLELIKFYSYENLTFCWQLPNLYKSNVHALIFVVLYLTNLTIMIRILFKKYGVVLGQIWQLHFLSTAHFSSKLTWFCVNWQPW
jgi:hypothetical protein